MRDFRTDLSERPLDFAVDVVQVAPRLQRSATGRFMVGQLVRSASSAGANFQEACGAESRADFAHKMQAVLKELRETEYWLKLVARSKVVPADLLSKPLADADELIRIVVKSVITAKSRPQL
jgi:four helix bundle protein